MAEQNYSLLIAALVAVVAIVGLVIYSNASGAIVYARDSPLVLGPQGQIGTSQSFYETGKDVGMAACTGPGTDNTCCNNACTQACAGVGEYKVSGRTVDECFRNCNSGCGYVVDEYWSTG